MFPIAAGPNPGMQMWVIDKSTALAGVALTVKNFAPGFTNNSTMIPAVTHDATEQNLYLVNTGFTASAGTVDLITLSQITGTAANPIWSTVPDAAGPFPGSGIFVAPTPYNTTLSQISGCGGDIVCAQQRGSTKLISAGDSRVINALVRNGKLWFSHAAGLPNEPAVAVREASFWYEVTPALLNTTANPVIQSGVIDPGISGGAIAYPSIAVNKNNDAVVGLSRMGPNRFIEAGFVSRLASDAPGTMSPVRVSKPGEASYFKNVNGGANRWGDYSATMVDPIDNTTFWTIQEYAATADPISLRDRWATWWEKVILQPAAGGGTGTATVGLYDPAASIFRLSNTTTGVLASTFLFGAGNLGWIPITGDWNGDGKDETGLYDPSTSIFYLRDPATGGVQGNPFLFGAGGLGWQPVAGDWDGL